MPQPGISVIVAALNEAGTIEACVRRIRAVYPDDGEVLVVAGGTDATADRVDAMAAADPRVRCIRNPDDRGKGHAIRVGIAHAAAPIHAQIDADLQFLPEELPRLADPIRRGEADVVLGTRFAPGATRLPGSTPVVRTLGNKAVSA
ncbi:MAG TPA: glycosyltransferase family 2 protein, partial [Myxococcota bacterium]|nr:glycosyltransferase family 2 protein [Myxococcota bacterium]